jgi:hypothetical protein
MKPFRIATAWLLLFGQAGAVPASAQAPAQPVSIARTEARMAFLGDGRSRFCLGLRRVWLERK